MQQKTWDDLHCSPLTVDRFHGYIIVTLQFLLLNLDTKEEIFTLAESCMVVKDMKCSVCEKEFRSNVNLNAHLQYEHEPKFKCEVCQKSSPGMVPIVVKLEISSLVIFKLQRPSLKKPLYAHRDEKVL